MAKRRIEGSFVALITPMNSDGSVDFKGFRTLLDFQEKNGSSAVLIMGSTGEVSMLTPDERRQVISETIKMRTGKMEFWYGCTGPSTEQTIGYVEYASKEGADGGGGYGYGQSGAAAAAAAAAPEAPRATHDRASEPAAKDEGTLRESRTESGRDISYM